MTHPAWPSNHWQIYSSDYDTQASYYGVKKASEPLHVQMNLPDYAVAVVNTTLEPRPGLVVRSRVLSLDDRLLASRVDRLTAPANQVTTLAPLGLAPLLAKQGMVVVDLTLTDASGATLSDNIYWQGASEAANQGLDKLAPQPLRVIARSTIDGDEVFVRVALEDAGTAPALATKLTLVDAKGDRILPAYYSDNYVSLLPGEPKQVEIRYPRALATSARINLRGWNVQPASVDVQAAP
jgi:hypothetical protein